MNYGKPLLLTLAIGLAACTNADRFGSGGDGGFGAGAGAGAGAGGLNGGGVTAGALDPASAEFFRQSVGDRVLFAVDQSTLAPEARAVLDGQVNWLNANPQYTAVIEGHADEQGTREYNLALGERRANSVRDYLVSRGIPSSRLRTVTFGKERPLEICSSEACYAKNRRAVTVVAAGGLTS